MSWANARAGLGRAVVGRLGEAVTLSDDDTANTADVRGLLVVPERTVEVAEADHVMAEAWLSLRTVDVPSWLDRGDTVTGEGGEVFDVVEQKENGEGMTEVILCRSS